MRPGGSFSVLMCPSACPAGTLARTWGHVKVLAGQRMTVLAMRPSATMPGRWPPSSSLLPPDRRGSSAGSTAPVAILALREILSGQQVSSGALSLQGLVMQSYGSCRRFLPAVLSVPIDLTTLAGTTSESVTVNVVQRELMPVNAVCCDGVPSSGGASRKDVRFRGHRPKVRWVHAVSMQAGSAALTGLRAVMALVISLKMPRLTTLGSQRLNEHVERPAVRWLRVPVTSPELPVTVPVDAARPMPTSVLASLDFQPETDRQSRVTKLNGHTLNRITPAYRWCG